MPLRALIVDDEPIARQILREELDQIGGVDIISEADDGAAALALIEQRRPDLVLLDLEMPVMGGFEVIRHLNPKGNPPVIVIVTAYDQYAVQAFDAGAIDYLLKPVRQDRLAQAVDRARRLLHNTSEIAERLSKLKQIAGPAAGARARKIIGKSGDEYVLLNFDEIFAFQAEGDLVWILTARQKFLATQTLRVLAERLENTNFRRIHRNAVVNLNHVRKLSSLSSRRWLVTMHNNLEFVVSKRQAAGVRGMLSW